MVERKTIGRKIKVTVDIKLLFAEFEHLLELCGHITQNQIVDTILEECHRRLHINLLIKSIRTRNPLPTARLICRTQHQILGQGMLMLLLTQSKERLWRKILIHTHTIVHKLVACRSGEDILFALMLHYQAIVEIIAHITCWIVVIHITNYTRCRIYQAIGISTLIVVAK